MGGIGARGGVARPQGAHLGSHYYRNCPRPAPFEDVGVALCHFAGRQV